jgi:regulator of sigma E protease
MDILVKAAQLILSLSILVVLHEFGHYIPAKLFKTRVEKFYLFFDPWFSLFKKKIGDTEWGIGWLPLGGYVKIAGMVDESMDKEQLKQEPKPDEFRSKKAWQRLIIMIGGVTVNVLVGILIYVFVVWGYGLEKASSENLKSGLDIHPYMEKFGLVTGDNILEVEGEKVENVNKISTQIFLRDARKLKVKKASGEIKTITLPADVDYELFKAGAMPIVSLRAKMAKVGEVDSKLNAAKAGLKMGDKVVSVNNKPITYYDDFKYVLFQNKGKKIDLFITRNGKEKSLKVLVDKDGKIGFTLGKAKFIDENIIETQHFSFTESVSKGFELAYFTVSDYASQLKYLFTKKGATSLGGFASMGNMFPSQWDWQVFWLNTGFISLVLAFMNILPIPALDGGHVVFLLYEIVTGKEAPQKVLEYAQYIGFILLLGLLLYANGNDIYKAIIH